MGGGGGRGTAAHLPSVRLWWEGGRGAAPKRLADHEREVGNGSAGRVRSPAVITTLSHPQGGAAACPSLLTGGAAFRWPALHPCPMLCCTVMPCAVLCCAQDGVEREIKAVDSEHGKNIDTDAWRLLQLAKHTANPEHPWARFATGGLGHGGRCVLVTSM